VTNVGAKFTLLLIISTPLSGCGGGKMPSPTITGISVQAQPSNQTAYASLASPQNQVSFNAYFTYSDLSVGTTPIANVQWTGDGANWVTLRGNVATCTQPAPVVVLPAFSTVNATAPANGSSYTSSSGLYCL
jgi:hypothetical protein